MEKIYVFNISLIIFGLIIAFANAQTSTTTQTTTVTYPTISLSCDFEKDFCNWTHYDDADAFKWQRSNGPTLTDLTGPLTDHTTQSLDGSYAYIKTSGIAANSTARIKSAPITVRSYSGYCFSFWYHMWGQAVNTLSLRLERMDDLTNSTIVWSRQTSQGNSWRYAQIAISEAGNFRLVFEGIAGPSDQGDIAVDDFVSKTSLCSATTYCDFETPELCGFYNSPLGIFNWTRYRGATPGFTTGPSFDHTTQTKNGYYMYIDAKYRNEYDYAVLISPGYKYYSSTPRCVEIWYHMYGYDAGTLNIYRMEKEGVSGKYLKVFSISGNQGNEWHILQVNVPINYNKEFFIAIEATVDAYDYYSWGLDGDIAIDDYTIKDSPCPPMGDCTFEDDLCAWKNAEKNVDFEWVRHRGETPSGSGATGPSIDHTYGTDRGTYLFIDTSSPTIKAGGKAQLVSSVFDRYTTRSFEFYYHMNVKNSSLSISRRNFRSTTTANLWSTNINQGDDWKYGCVSILNNVTSNYVLVIEGVAIGGPNSGDIALDDFKIINGQTCPTEDELCALKCHDTQKCVPLSKVCDFIEDCSGGEDEIGCGYRNVTFESDLGDWQTSEDTFSKWVRARSGNDGEFGPTIDHTTESTSGYFLNLVRNAQAKSIESAVFRSPVMRNTYSVCRMRLWYQLNGRGNGLIDIFINMGTQKSRALRITDPTYNEWKEVIVPIGTYRSGFSVSIEANRTYSVIGNIAIDDISFHDCTPTYSPTCFWNQTRCNNSVCISSTSRYCDMVDDCGDFSDEESKRCSAYPFKCDFESGVCQWTPDDSNLFNWQRVKANEATPSLAPGRDHTTNTGSGAYFLIDAKGKPSGAISRIFGPKISSKVNSCRIRFFYYMYGRSVAQLRILSRYEVGGYLSSRWTKVGSVGEFWERGEVTMYPYSSTSPAVQWVIEAQVANVTNVDGIIAIDDITFDPECTIPAGEMPTVFTTTSVPTCGADGYKCPEWNGKCIKKSQLCDFQVDCPNGDDEKNCGICDFENSTCGWYDNSYGDHIWNRTKAGDAGIDKDVLPGTSKGFVIDYETMEGAFNGLTRLYSPILGRTSASCEFEFYYYKKSSPNPRSTSLSLYLENTDLSKERLWRTEDNSVNSDWTRILVNLHSRTAGIRLYFEASHADQIGDNRPIIALDNINFLNCLTVYNTSCNSTNVFTCSASNCIPNSMVCDHSKDCLEGEDEQSCSLYKRCDFESESNSLCDWGEDDDSDLKIKRSKGAAYLSSSLNFPTFDHTTLKSDGFYLHNDLSGGDGKTTRISSPIFYPPSGDKCAFRMWYYMSDNRGTAPALTVYQRTMIGGPMTVLWQKSNLISSDWARTEIILRADRTFQIVVEITNKNAEVAIDDLSFTPECRVNLVDKLPSYIFTTPSPDASCGISNQFRCSTSRECVDMSALCNFRYECADKSDEAFCPWQCNFDDNTMCSWTNEIKGTNSQPKTKWITASGDINDHTTLSTSGIYLTIDMSGKQPGDMARLVSPVYNQAGFTCNFEFWLLSLTDQSSKVNVYVRSELTESRVLTVSPSSLGTWKYVSIDLPTCLSQFQIVVEGVIGSTNKSFIGLDDFLLVNCEYPKGEAASTTCQIGQFTCASKHCIAQDAICDLSEDCCDASDEKEDLCSAYSRCNFEEDMCGFRNVIEEETKHLWERERADSESTELIDKPLLDHSKQSAKGHYLLLKRNEDSKVGEKASIEIPMKSSDVGCRLRLWYWLSKQFYAELGVFVRESIGERWTNIYQNINPTNQWTRADIEIPTMKNFQLLITGELDKNTEGFLALDDFSFSPECAIDLDLVLPTFEPLTTDPNSFDSTTKGIDKPSTSSDLGLILGIVIPCCILLIAGLVVGGVFFVKKRKSQATNSSEEDAKKLPSMDEGPPGLFNKNFNDN